VRKLIALFVVAVAFSALSPARAAVNTVVAGPGAFALTYATPRVVLDRSAPSTFVNADPAPHNVWSVATRKINNVNVPLFSSAVINLGETAPITFLPSVAAGDYEFFCTLHPGMRGTATVR